MENKQQIVCSNRNLYYLVNCLGIGISFLLSFFMVVIPSDYLESLWYITIVTVFFIISVVWLVLSYFSKSYMDLFNYTLDVEYYDEKITLTCKYFTKDIYRKFVGVVTYKDCIKQKLYSWKFQRSVDKYVIGLKLVINFGNQKIELFTPISENHKNKDDNPFSRLYNELEK